MRLGHSALMRKALKKEQQLQNEMIQSLMPQEVAREVMQGSYDSEGDEEDEEEEEENVVANTNDGVAGGLGSSNEVQMGSLEMNKKKGRRKSQSSRKDGRNRDSASISDDSDDYSADEAEPLRGVEGGTSCESSFAYFN